MGLTKEERQKIYKEARAIQEEFNRLRGRGPEAEEQRAVLVKRYEELDRLLRAARTGAASASQARDAEPPPSADVKERVACPFCAEEILAKAKKCRYCGEWLPDEWWKGTVPVVRLVQQAAPEESARCGSCDKTVPADATHCPHCGNPLGAEGEGSEPSVVPAPEPVLSDTAHAISALVDRPESSDVFAAEPAPSDTAHAISALVDWPEPSDVPAAETAATDTTHAAELSSLVPNLQRFAKSGTGVSPVNHGQDAHATMRTGLPPVLAVTGVVATSILVVYLGYVNGGTKGAVLTAAATLLWIALVSLILKFRPPVGKPTADIDEE